MTDTQHKNHQHLDLTALSQEVLGAAFGAAAPELVKPSAHQMLPYNAMEDGEIVGPDLEQSFPELLKLQQWAANLYKRAKANSALTTTQNISVVSEATVRISDFFWKVLTLVYAKKQLSLRRHEDKVVLSSPQETAGNHALNPGPDDPAATFCSLLDSLLDRLLGSLLEGEAVKQSVWEAGDDPGPERSN